MKHPYAFYAVCLLAIFGLKEASSQQLHTHSNAASVVNESNSLDGWTIGNAIGSIETNDVFHGSYSLKFESPFDGWYRGTYRFNTVQNGEYLITISAKSSSTENPEINISGTAEQSFTLISSNWTTYNIPVKASGSSIDIRMYTGLPSLKGNTALVDQVSIIPIDGSDTQAPTSPALSSTWKTDTTVNLSWSGATDNVNVIGYKIYKNGSYITNTANVSSYLMTGLTAGTNYNFVVKAMDAGGNVSVDSNQISISTNSSPDNQSPTAPTLSSTGQSQTTAYLSWSDATDDTGVIGYRIFKDGILEASLGNVTSHQVTGLTASTTYSFTVSAFDATGNESIQSAAVSITTDAASGGGSGTSVWSESGSTASYTGVVAIGANSVPAGYKLAVDGNIRTREIRVDQETWPDYVFNKDYNLPTLEEIQKHIDEKGHLPNIPSAQEVQAHGMDVGEMNKLLLEKIEESTLHNISQEKLIQFQKNQILQLMEKVLDQEIRIKKLEDIIKNIDHE